MKISVTSNDGELLFIEVYNAEKFSPDNTYLWMLQCSLMNEVIHCAQILVARHEESAREEEENHDES